MQFSLLSRLVLYLANSPHAGHHFQFLSFYKLCYSHLIPPVNLRYFLKNKFEDVYGFDVLKESEIGKVYILDDGR